MGEMQQIIIHYVRQHTLNIFGMCWITLPITMNLSLPVERHLSRKFHLVCVPNGQSQQASDNTLKDYSFYVHFVILTDTVLFSIMFIEVILTTTRLLGLLCLRAIVTFFKSRKIIITNKGRSKLLFITAQFILIEWAILLYEVPSLTANYRFHTHLVSLKNELRIMFYLKVFSKQNPGSVVFTTVGNIANKCEWLRNVQ